MTKAKAEKLPVRAPKPPAVLAREIMRRAEKIWGYVRANANSLDSERTCKHISEAIKETNDIVEGELKYATVAYNRLKAEHRDLTKMHESLLGQTEACNLGISKLRYQCTRLEAKLSEMEAKANEGEEWKEA